VRVIGNTFTGVTLTSSPKKGIANGTCVVEERYLNTDGLINTFSNMKFTLTAIDNGSADKFQLQVTNSLGNIYTPVNMVANMGIVNGDIIVSP